MPAAAIAAWISSTVTVPRRVACPARVCPTICDANWVPIARPTIRCTLVPATRLSRPSRDGSEKAPTIPQTTA